MKTDERQESRSFSRVAVEERFAPPRAGFSPTPSPSWVRRMLPIVRSHIGALGAYLRQATDHGLVIAIMNSDPGMRTVAPAG